MSYSKFALSLKSTLDYEAKLLADSKGLPFIDMNAEGFETTTLESDQLAVCWEFASMSEDPRDPFYIVMFDIGVAAFLDPAQYISLDTVSMFQDAFSVGRSIAVKDYSGDDMPTQQEGMLYVVASGITPQHAERTTGLRFITVTARAVRYGT